MKNEDEKIRKMVLKAFKLFAEKQVWVGHCLDDIDWDKCIAWLEKQGGKKTIDDKVLLITDSHVVNSIYTGASHIPVPIPNDVYYKSNMKVKVIVLKDE